MSETTRAEGIRPFYCGSQYADWQCSNCDRCTKAYDEDAEHYRCDIQEALDWASLLDGEVSPEIARRMGIGEETRDHFLWQCGEVEWTEEWKAEWRVRQTRCYRIEKALWTARRAVRRWLAERRDRTRAWLLMPVARRMDRRESSCWADWCGWALGYSDRPGPDSSRSCREEIGPGESCWCGKFRGSGIEEARP